MSFSPKQAASTLRDANCATRLRKVSTPTGSRIGKLPRRNSRYAAASRRMMALAEFISSASRTYAATHRLPIGTAFGGSPKSRLGAINSTLPRITVVVYPPPPAAGCHHQDATLNVGPLHQMARLIVQHVAALTEGPQILQTIVGGITVQVCRARRAPSGTELPPQGRAYGQGVHGDPARSPLVRRTSPRPAGSGGGEERPQG